MESYRADGTLAFSIVLLFLLKHTDKDSCSES
jgi:hypothetical protein